jgi:hypothetical protein
MIKLLASLFRGLNTAIGVSTLSKEATPAQERKFVFIWLGIVAFILLWCLLIVYWFTSS